MILDNPYASGSLRVQNDITASSAEFTGTVNVTGTLNATVEGTAATASYIELANVDGSGSLASRIEAQEQFSASLDATYATDAQVLAVSSSLSGSLAVDIASNLSSIGDLQTDSGSFSTRVTAVEGGVSSLNSATSSYLQNTTDTLDGDLTVTGTITAQEFHTEYTSASIIYQSGSTKFGDSVDDVHQFTGSISSTGNITVDNTRPDITLLESDTSNTNTLLRHQTSLFRIDTINDAQDTITRRLTIDHTNGKVGIGTDNPSQKLHVNGNIFNNKIIIRDDAIERYDTASDDAGIAFNYFGYNTTYDYFRDVNIYNGKGGLIAKFDGSSKNIGINETSPSAPIHISKQTTWGTTTNRSININNTGTGGDVNAEHNMGSITWYSGNSLPTAEIAAYRNVPAAGNNIELVFKTYSQSLGSTVEAMRIDKVGNVGIGTTTVNAALEVYGSGAGSVSDHMRISSTDTEAKLAFVTTDGNSAIASTSDELRFFTNTANVERMKITSGGDINISTSGATLLFADNGEIRSNDANHRILFRRTENIIEIREYGHILFSPGSTSGTQTGKVYFQNDGKVGIGTTSPLAKLDVRGGAYIDGVYQYTAAYASLDTTGHVVAALGSASNGQSALFEFVGSGNNGGHFYIIFSCYNGGGTWYYSKNVVSSGGIIDIEPSGAGTTVTFTFKTTSGVASYTPLVMIRATGAAISTAYM